jgi:hypothetical protein
MRLFIRIKDGEPFEHPLLEENVKQAFPGVDFDNLPPEFAPFERLEPPAVGLYEVCDTNYEWIDGVVKDVHHVRPMTSQEKLDKQNAVKAKWSEKVGFQSWIFNEETCSFDPPVPYPEDGKKYVWDEPTTSWVVAEQ